MLFEKCDSKLDLAQSQYGHRDVQSIIASTMQIVGCGIGIGLTIVFVRRYVQLIKAQKQEGRDEDHHESAG